MDSNGCPHARSLLDLFVTNCFSDSKKMTELHGLCRHVEDGGDSGWRGRRSGRRSGHRSGRRGRRRGGRRADTTTERRRQHDERGIDMEIDRYNTTRHAAISGFARSLSNRPGVRTRASSCLPAFSPPALHRYGSSVRVLVLVRTMDDNGDDAVLC